MLRTNRSQTNRTLVLLLMALIALVSGAVFLAPRDATMGDAQRIVYVHVAVAWNALAAFVVMAATGAAYLRTRDLKWDAWMHAAAESGWLCCTLTLVSGSIWAHEAWGTWWTWDPRITTVFILWLLYSTCLVLRGHANEEHLRARLSADVAIVGALDVPLVALATRWFRGMHPVAPEMEPRMLAVLLLSLLSFTLFFAVVVYCRQTILARRITA